MTGINNNNFALEGRLSNYLDPPTPTPASGISNKISRVSSYLKQSLFGIVISIKLSTTNSNRSKLFGKKNVEVASVNHGKPSDSKWYRVFSYSSVSVKPSGKDALRPAELLFCGNLDKLSPTIWDNGKCLGASNYFISDYLYNGEDLRKTAQKFKGGVPIEGVLNQQIYRQVSSSNRADFESAIQNVFFNKKDFFEASDFTKEQNNILKELKEELNRLKREKCPPSLIYLLDHIKNQYITIDPITQNFTYKISALNLSSLERALKYPDLPINYQAIARLNDLKIEQSSGDKDPQSILNAVVNLPPGSYILTFPVMNSSGTIIGYHSTALIIKKAGPSYFYDPNYGIARTLNPQETVRRVFKHYTGYGNGKLERIENKILRNANFSDSEMSFQFSLAEYRKFKV